MTRYLISFDDGAMTFPEEEMPDVAKAGHEVVQEAKDAGVWVFGGGLESQRASVVATDGTVTDGPYPETKEVLGGFAVVDVPSRCLLYTSDAADEEDSVDLGGRRIIKK